MGNGLTKNWGLAKLQLNCKGLVVSFFERFFASQSLKFLGKTASESTFFDLAFSGISIAKPLSRVFRNLYNES